MDNPADKTLEFADQRTDQIDAAKFSLQRKQKKTETNVKKETSAAMANRTSSSDAKNQKPSKSGPQPTRTGSGDPGMIEPHKEFGTDGKKAQSQMTKAERREIQERQRAAKGAAKTGQAPSGAIAVPQRPAQTPSSSLAKSSPRSQNSLTEVGSGSAHLGSPQLHHKVNLHAKTQPAEFIHDRQRSFNSETVSSVGDQKGSSAKLAIFSHLPLPKKDMLLLKDISFSSDNIHPAVVKLGIQYSNGIISGSNARCMAFIDTMKQVIMDYSTPPEKALPRDLETVVKRCVSFLNHCRPQAVSMGNAVRQLKWLITHTPADMPDGEAKEKLTEQLDDYAREKIDLAAKQISETYASKKIKDGDVILTYSCSSLVTEVLVTAHESGKRFSVVVMDARPKNEGKELLRRLVRQGIRCSYANINSISYIMPEITKVVMGAECLLANGYVMSRVGSSQIALVAKAYNVPVLICCETYKFWERVLTDSVVYNELGNPEDLRIPGLLDSADVGLGQNPSLLNFLFDVTPPDMITMVITELGMLPCTSVPVILRVKHNLK